MLSTAVSFISFLLAKHSFLTYAVRTAQSDSRVAVAVDQDGSLPSITSANESEAQASSNRSAANSSDNTSRPMLVTVNENVSMPRVLAHSFTQHWHVASDKNRSIHNSVGYRGIAVGHDAVINPVAAFGLAAAMVLLALCPVVCAPLMCRYPSRRSSGKEESDEIATLALSLQRNVQKYPLDSHDLGFTPPKDRFVAILPHKDFYVKYARVKGHATSFSKEVQQRAAKSGARNWVASHLCWWDNQSDFFKNERPKGYIKVASIVSISGGQEEKLSHKEIELRFIDMIDDVKVRKLLLLLPSQAEALDWANMFSLFLEKARPATSSFPWRRHGTVGGNVKAYADSCPSEEEYDPDSS